MAAGYLYACYQDNSWIDEPTMRLYLREKWFKESIFKTSKNTLLIMDRARSYFSQDITDLFNIYIIYINSTFFNVSASTIGYSYQ